MPPRLLEQISGIHASWWCGNRPRSPKRSLEHIEQLLDAGYKGETQEEIVDAWFKTIVTQMLQEEGQDIDRDMGYINVVPIDKGKSEVS